MAEERKTDEALEKAVETDEDIDRYIRELTGKETPKDKEKKAEEKKAPEKEEFRVTSQIGEDRPQGVHLLLGAAALQVGACRRFILGPLAFSLPLCVQRGGRFLRRAISFSALRRPVCGDHADRRDPLHSAGSPRFATVHSRRRCT